jgi:hypothetical protein
MVYTYIDGIYYVTELMQHHFSSAHAIIKLKKKQNSAHEYSSRNCCKS